MIIAYSEQISPGTWDMSTKRKYAPLLSFNAFDLGKGDGLKGRKKKSDDEDIN